MTECMRVPNSHFNRFKQEFLRWQERLGLASYRVCFERYLGTDAFADIDVSEDGQIAVTRLCVEVSKPNSPHYRGPEYHAKHEALHLLTHRLVWLAQQRYVSKDEISREWEALVRRLEKVL